MTSDTRCLMTSHRGHPAVHYTNRPWVIVPVEKEPEMYDDAVEGLWDLVADGMALVLTRLGLMRS